MFSTMNLRCCLLLCLAAIVCGSMPRRLYADETPAVDFNRDIRPILSNVCFACHGPDAKQRKAELRLDVKPGLFGEGATPGVIVPGKLADSELFQRITSKDEDERMPPADAPRKLTPKQIDLIRRWIEQGADWQQHWAYITPKRPALPKVENSAWPRSPIDYFVLARLERQGLTPSPEAEKTTLIRRVSL